MSKFGGPCLVCGHPADFHGVTFCALVAGGGVKRPCDCSGYENPAGEEPKPGMCGEHSPLLLHGCSQVCALTAGHAGWHEDEGARWSPQPKPTDVAGVLERVTAALAGDEQAVLKVAAAQQILIDAGYSGGEK